MYYYHYPWDLKETEKVAFINGIRVHYDVCSENHNPESYRKAFRYIGCGDVFSINGVVQGGKPVFWHFFVRK